MFHNCGFMYKYMNMIACGYMDLIINPNFNDYRGYFFQWFADPKGETVKMKVLSGTL